LWFSPPETTWVSADINEVLDGLDE